MMADKTEARPILIVEDVREISLQMGAMLNGKGHRVTYATDAESAIRMAENDRPRMILTDLDLPTFDALIALIRGHVDLKQMLVAIMDINNPEVNPSDKVTVLSTLAQLDDLLCVTAAASD